MARVKGAMMTRKRRKKVLKLAKGYYGGKSRLFRTAKQAVMKSGQYAYIGRKQRKRDFRRLWISRISAGAKNNGLNYSTFMHGLKVANVDLNRKMLSELAIQDPEAFSSLAQQAKAALI
jgi:large subunit ribosomal protein L20